MESFLQQLYNYVKWQQQEITNMKVSMAELSKEIQKLKDKPSVTVERLEYKFDQLKVETLEGTLNIGLNPTDLNNIDDLSVSSQTPNGVMVKKNPLLKNNLLNRLNQFINQDLETVIRDTEKQLDIKLEPEYVHLIQEDIQKQMPGRIEHYIHFFGTRSSEDVSEEQMMEQIYKKIIADIHQGVHTFINQMSLNRKDGK